MSTISIQSNTEFSSQFGRIFSLCVSEAYNTGFVINCIHNIPSSLEIVVSILLQLFIHFLNILYFEIIIISFPLSFSSPNASCMLPLLLHDFLLHKIVFGYLEQNVLVTDIQESTFSKCLMTSKMVAPICIFSRNKHTVDLYPLPQLMLLGQYLLYLTHHVEPLFVFADHIRFFFLL